MGSMFQTALPPHMHRIIIMHPISEETPAHLASYGHQVHSG